MKKIFLALSAFLLVIAVKAQNSRTEGARKLSVAEANQLNGVAEPTINGKPYSQYKAEQEALKVQQSTAKKPAGYISPVAATKGEPKIQPEQKSGPDNQVAPTVQSAVVKTAEAAKPQQAPTLHEQALARSKDFTGNGPDGKPAPAAEKAGKPGTEGGGNAPVPAATVKVQKTAAASTPGPVAPVAMPDAAAANSNSTGGTVEKPAAQPAPKTKSEQAPEGKTGEGN